MSPLAILGFLTVIIMLVLIMTKKASPLVALIVVPVVTGIISCFFIAVVPEGAAEGTQGVVDFVANFKSLGDMITGSKGIGSVAATGVMFIFSILFFGILTDAGTFRPIIKGILNLVGTDPVKIGIGTAILAAVVHLDGSGAVTFLICVPALLPLYDALGMRRTTLATIVALSVGTMNILPWGGPTIRAATALGMGEAHIVDADGQRRRAACMGGMLTVLNGDVHLVATTWEWAEEIDQARAEASKKRAEEILARKDLDEREYELAQARLKRALVRTSVH